MLKRRLLSLLSLESEFRARKTCVRTPCHGLEPTALRPSDLGLYRFDTAGVIGSYALVDIPFPSWVRRSLSCIPARSDRT
jgi:hypothetical protein